ncbi:DUF4124 domain-containing protein [Methylovorus mays]|uniref:DUF4124 domain-containing protein n=1 Tax=Methylovorus mays TaxID=184077 RepID=UPI001E5E40BC|nr:DUF4124 domain-containing protein [Methylovorus mays]MCB5206460.1 DUF4124 domain-containing protein [Methylovorus mays]
MMHSRLFAIALLLLPLVAMADVYKWKDTNGTTRYSDIPPKNLPYETVGGGKIAAPAPTPAKAPAEEGASNKDPRLAKEIDAQRRRDDAERSKKQDQLKQAADKQKQENCAAARGNLANYQQGGRIYKMNADGEREYLDDNAIDKGLEEAQKQVDKYCK